MPLTNNIGSCSAVAHILPLLEDTKNAWSTIPTTTVLTSVKITDIMTAYTEVMCGLTCRMKETDIIPKMNQK